MKKNIFLIFSIISFIFFIISAFCGLTVFELSKVFLELEVAVPPLTRLSIIFWWLPSIIFLTSAILLFLRHKKQNNVPFLSRTRTDWKILLVVILMALITGGVLVYLSRMETVKEPIVEWPTGGSSVIEKPADETVYWQTYKSEEYGFEFKYPSVPSECQNCIINDQLLSSRYFSVGRFLLKIEDLEELSLSAHVYKLFPKEWESAQVEKTGDGQYLKETFVESREIINLGNEEAIKIEYRSGGSGRFGTAVFVERDRKVFSFGFTAGGFCCVWQDKIYEEEIYHAMLSTFSFLQDKEGYKELKERLVLKFKDRVPGEWGEAVSGVKTRLDTEEKVIALTFDACGGLYGSGYDKQLIDYFKNNQIEATLFINGRWIDANPDIFQELKNNPLFQIENHGMEHKPCSVNGASAYGEKGTRSVDEVVDEVELNARKIKELTGEKPKYYRSGTAYYDEVCVEIIEELGYQAVNYNILGDAGATFSENQVKNALLSAGPGSIALFHMNRPKGETAEGIIAAIPALKDRGYRFVKLSEYNLK